MRIIAVTIATAALTVFGGAPAEAQSRGYGMANPASTYCGQIGGISITRRDRDGGAVGYCRLRDGREVDEWQLYRDRGQRSDRRAWSDRDGPRGYDDRRAAYREPAARSCTGNGGRYYTARPTNGGEMRGWCRTRDGRIWDAEQLYRQYGGGGDWNDDRGADGNQDYSYQQQYRSWDDRSDQQYDGRRDDDEGDRYQDDRDDQSYGEDDRND